MTIPPYPEFEPIGLHHKAEIDELFARREPAISEFTFTNLFIWRHHYMTSVSRKDGFTLFLARPEGKEPFFFPPWGDGDASGMVRECLKFLAETSGAGHIARMPEDYLSALGPLGEGVAVPDPGNDDYVYASEDLALLKGRKYDGKRNALARFRREWAYEYRPIAGEMVRRCQELEDYWCVERQCPLYPGLRAEERAIRDLIEKWGALQARGGAIVVEGRVAAFSIGEKLNNSTFVVHIEKADPRLPGLYAIVNNEFATREAAAYNYVNREQDLGDEGLRAAKLSYHPVRMVRKYRIVAHPPSPLPRKGE